MGYISNAAEDMCRVNYLRYECRTNMQVDDGSARQSQDCASEAGYDLGVGQFQCAKSPYEAMLLRVHSFPCVSRRQYESPVDTTTHSDE
jgi:hypothetical protein